MFEIFPSWTRISGFSNSHSISSALVTKCAERKPRSNCIPSTTSIAVSSDLPSSTVMTPSLPTFIIASPISLPIEAWLLAEMVATWRISAVSEIGFACFSSAATTAVAPARSPALMRAGAAPAVTARRPWVKIASVSRVAVVVPSPALSLV